MTLLPELEQRLVLAAGHPPRRGPGSAAALRAGALAAVVAALVILLARTGDPPGTPADGAPDVVAERALTKARALTRAPDPDAGPVLDAGALTAVVSRIQATLPYPPGQEGDLLEVVHPPRSAGDMSGVSVERDAQLLGEYRAWCAWQRSWLSASGTVRADATAVLGTVPQWPTFRGGGGQQARVVADAAAAGDVAPIATYAARNCTGLRRTAP